ncbi:HWE histidine kinase domain-containing protein [Aurantiacibacter hainanensis]|uniref:HWE histidine kinase domain-containing protein n=1 Tax=Aurantiacibacter hainanensis TaxID=3076114 RepID=UPI0030C6AEB8
MPERLNRLETILSGKRRDLAFRIHGLLPPRRSLRAGIIAFSLLLLAIVLKLVVDDWVGDELPPFIFLYSTVVISALVAGARTGAIIAALSCVVAWIWFFPPFSSFSLESTTAVISLEIYAVTSIFLALAVGFARHTLDLAIASEELRNYDAQEAIHRIKNLLAVVQAITIGSLRDTQDIDEYRKLISRRLNALSGAQDLLLRRKEASASVDELAQAALNPFLPNKQIVIDCANEVLVPARYMHGLTLALFELATNSGKYGAMGHGEGEISLSCKRDGDTVALTWRETSPYDQGEAAPDDINEGFGRKLIDVALRRDPGTEVVYDRSEQGIAVTFSWTDKAGPVAS